jgi:hypothetical protein
LEKGHLFLGIFEYGEKLYETRMYTMANDSVSFWLGPIVVYLLLHITPLYGVASHAIGVLTKLGKLRSKYRDK